MYKSSLLFFSITLVAATASLQSGGPRWGDFTWALRAESRADMISIHEDMRFVQVQAKATPTMLRAFWNDFRSDWKDLKADATADSKVAAARIAQPNH